MRPSTNLKVLGVLFACMIVMGAAQTALAAGTSSGTSISNTADVDYQVGGVDQTTITSNAAAFVVDNKIDMTVAAVDVTAVQVAPGATAQVLTYSVTNNGNTVQDYSFTAEDLASGGTWGAYTDNFDATGAQVFVEDDTTAGYQAGEDTDTYVDELDPDQTATVYIVAAIPIARVDDDVALFDLIAQVAEGGSAGSQGADILSDDSGSADDPDEVQTVFADGAGTDSGDAASDGVHSARDGYEVNAATLVVAKSSSTVEDPINGTTNPKAIPGATVRYTVTVTNNGGADATSVVLVDQIPANSTYKASTITLDAGALTDGDDVDEGDYNVTNAGAVTVSIGTVSSGGGSSTVTFDVTID